MKLSTLLGFSIGYDTLGYGVVISHPGTIVVGDNNKIGNYAVLHTSTCVTGDGKMIGDGFYLSTGAKVVKKITIGNNVIVGANAVVNKSIDRDNVLIAGIPAKIINEAETWYKRDNFSKRVDKIEKLKIQMFGVENI